MSGGIHLLKALPGQLQGELKTQVVTVSGGPTLLPGDPLKSRKDFLVYNDSTTDTVFIGGSNVTDVIGIPLLPAGTFALQAGRAEVWATVSGSDVSVKVMEVA